MARTDPALGPHQEIEGAIKQTFPQADQRGIKAAIKVLRQSNRANGGA